MVQHIDNLTLPVYYPETLFHPRLPYRHIAALLEPMGNCPTIPGITKPLDEIVATSGSDNHQKSYGARVAHLVQHVSKLGILGGAVSIDDIPKSLSFRWRLFGVEGRDIKLSEISSDVTVAAFVVPTPERIPIAGCEITRRNMGPRYVVTTIFGGQIYAVCLIVGGENDTDAVQDVVRAKKLLVHEQHIRRRGGEHFRMLIELVAIDVSQVPGFV